jgi:hypothetical protein
VGGHSVGVRIQHRGQQHISVRLQLLLHLRHSSALSDSQPHKGTVSRDFLLLVYFHESVSPQSQSILLGPFRFFSKIRGDIHKSRCTTGINDRWQICEYSKTALLVYSGAWGKLIHEKNQKEKISRHCPFLMDLEIKTQSTLLYSMLHYRRYGWFFLQLLSLNIRSIFSY